MALVTYSDSENSDSEPESKPQPTQHKKTLSAPPKASKQSSEFQSLVDRGNPRKIRVNLPDIKPEGGTKEEEEDGGPARKKPRVGAGGQFSGFNSFLPAPKRNTLSGAKGGEKDQGEKKAAPVRNGFSLKTGATPGFDRNADAEMRQEFSLNGTAGGSEGPEEIPAGAGNNGAATTATEEKTEEPVKKKSAMMFKPLSVARNTTKKKRPMDPSKQVSNNPGEPNQPTNNDKDPSSSQKPEPAPKPKVSLFGFSKEEKPVETSTQGSYEPLVYSTGPSATESEAPQQDVPAYESEPQMPIAAPGPNEGPTLNSIADDLNLSKAQKRQLFGRNAPSSFTEPSASSSGPRILTFNTDAEYASNQALLSSTSESERASLQHNPVRAIAPGKHSLQQLVNVASNQREALEESFASGRRNKKEAGSRYGW
ncbi:hypothetical protein FQN54_005189 [Arachnomyces sp. PD_36]|nr:hypothetical protein FQN54_005189 [Arachnomyces sp. PD_36]